ncbi:Nitrilase family, member 2 [Seminavis robusta]|uniref:Nitrilase family, member 2 n=1 Tax=Seminavis robusta TaxID=568900 RepID=A0A9N8H887_9STRA|nr:Nitrilase family, member 2 [Seminavis robusta]|eukprot:Sro152_g069590.1 Nitrilase family, member 2 (240) ;mRNA; f:92386-93275
MVDRGNFKQQQICFLDESIVIQAKMDSKNLPPSFKPDNWSVICGRGKECYGHVGNKRLKVLVNASLERYSATKSKMEKTLIVTSIVDSVREASPSGGFVKQDPKTKSWYEVGDAVAREKVGQLLREALSKRRAKVQPKKSTFKEAKAASLAQVEPAKMQTPSVSELLHNLPQDLRFVSLPHGGDVVHNRRRQSIRAFGFGTMDLSNDVVTKNVFEQKASEDEAEVGGAADPRQHGYFEL